MRKAWRYWRELATELDIEPGLDDAAFRGFIIPMYTDPSRKYHNLDHPVAMIEDFRPLRHMAINPTLLESAIWTHDLSNDPQSTRNEITSSQQADSLFRALGMASAWRAKLKLMILATDHKHIEVDPDTQLLCDLDLAILGKSPAAYDRYTRNIRLEYDMYTDSEFKFGRIKILQLFLDREQIYYTSEFRSRYEKKARENIQREIDKLTKS